MTTILTADDSPEVPILEEVIETIGYYEDRHAKAFDAIWAVASPDECGLLNTLRMENIAVLRAYARFGALAATSPEANKTVIWEYLESAARTFDRLLEQGGYQDVMRLDDSRQGA